MSNPEPTADPLVVAASERLLEASASGVPCDPVRDLIGADDLVRAYAVQERLTAARLAAGATVVGRKIGLTSPAVQAQLGVDQPDFGVLFAELAHTSGEEVPVIDLLQHSFQLGRYFERTGTLDGSYPRAQLYNGPDGH